MAARIAANSKVNSFKIFRKKLNHLKLIHRNQAISSSSVNQKLLTLWEAAMSSNSWKKISQVVIYHFTQGKRRIQRVTLQSGLKNVEVLQVPLVILSTSALSKVKVQREDQMMREHSSKLPMSTRPSSKSTKFKCN